MAAMAVPQWLAHQWVGVEVQSGLVTGIVPSATICSLAEILRVVAVGHQSQPMVAEAAVVVVVVTAAVAERQ